MLIAAAMPGGPIAPVWLVIPMAMVTLIVVSAHVAAVGRADMPATRKRIRTVNGVLMMFTIPLAAYAFGLADPGRPRLFVTVWTITAGLVILVLLLALLDIGNTILMQRHERQVLRRQLAAAREEMRRIASSKSEPHPAPPP